jgi:hypothetical protein
LFLFASGPSLGGLRASAGIAHFLLVILLILVFTLASESGNETNENTLTPTLSHPMGEGVHRWQRWFGNSRVIDIVRSGVTAMSDHR